VAIIITNNYLSLCIQYWFQLVQNIYIVLQGCEIWFLALREERRLRVFENGMVKRMFGPNRDDVTG
jgi:hypothetical protein